MILLITSSSQGPTCATGLQKATGKKVMLAGTVRQGLTMLRHQDFTVVVIDEALLATTAAAADVLWTRLRSAIPVVANFTVQSPARLLREVTAAVQRVEQEKHSARQAAGDDLRSELRDELTGILLESEMALNAREPMAVQGHLRSVLQLAQRIRQRLEP